MSYQSFDISSVRMHTMRNPRTVEPPTGTTSFWGVGRKGSTTAISSRACGASSRRRCSCRISVKGSVHRSSTLRHAMRSNVPLALEAAAEEEDRENEEMLMGVGADADADAKAEGGAD